MKASEFVNSGINPATAYIIGLTLPLYKEKKLRGSYYIIGAVNHNANMITEEEIALHFMSVNSLIEESLPNADDCLVYNQSPIYGTIQPKKGFSVILEKDIDIYSSMVESARKILNEPENIKVAFVKGCFDGRSSFDTSRHYLSLDVDRKLHIQEIIKDIINSLGISVNLNQREYDHPKNDQVRIAPQSLRKYMTKVGFYSERRKTIIQDFLNSL